MAVTYSACTFYDYQFADSRQNTHSLCAMSWALAEAICQKHQPMDCIEIVLVTEYHQRRAIARTGAVSTAG